MDSIDQVRQEHPEHLARFRAAPELRPDLNRPISPWKPANQASQHLTRSQNYRGSSNPVAGAGWPRSPRSQPAL